ncbi:MAG: hypothetical protein MI975_10020 [Cytophagales bacterium]|nr:hypothetical protein [Cytophagales bacterium]
MIFLRRKIIALIIFAFAALSGYAQEEDFLKDEGEVVEGEFLISKELEISLPPAQRIFQKVAPDEIDEKKAEPLQYSFSSYTPQLRDINTRLRVLKLKNEKFASRPGSYLNMGFGNYVTPYLEAALNSGVNTAGNYGLKVYHLSSARGPVDKGNSGSSTSAIDLFGKYVGGKASLAGDVGYTRNGVHFYGYDDGMEVDKDTIKQVYNDLNLSFDIKSSDVDAPVQYGIYGKLHNISDDYNASELGIKAGLYGDYLINENMRAKLALDFLNASYKNPDNINRALVRIHPSFVYSNFGLTLDVGMKILNNNDTLNNKNNTRLLPSISVGYDLSDNITAYGKLDGDVEEVTFKSIANENPFVNSHLPLAHTNKNLDLHIGLKGSLIQYLAFDVGIRSVLYKHMYFFVNDPAETSKFMLVFDEGNTSLFQGLISLSYFKSNLMGTTLSARFNAFNTGEIEKAWHKPKFELDYSFWYSFYNKVKLTADLFILTGMEARTFEFDSVVSKKLDGAVDLNVKVDYILSDRYGAFVSVNNLLNNNYEIYNRYPTRGLLAMVGVSISF